MKIRIPVVWRLYTSHDVALVNHIATGLHQSVSRGVACHKVWEGLERIIEIMSLHGIHPAELGFKSVEDIFKKGVVALEYTAVYLAREKVRIRHDIDCMRDPLNVFADEIAALEDRLLQIDAEITMTGKQISYINQIIDHLRKKPIFRLQMKFRSAR